MEEIKAKARKIRDSHKEKEDTFNPVFYGAMEMAKWIFNNKHSIKVKQLCSVEGCYEPITCPKGFCTQHTPQTFSA